MRSVLIVEDDEAIRDTVRLALEFSSIPVVTASNGLEGLELLPRIERPGLILLDMMMPVLDGWGFLHELRSRPGLAGIPVVAMTAADDGKNPIAADAVVQKPLDLQALMKVARAYCA